LDDIDKIVAGSVERFSTLKEYIIRRLKAELRASVNKRHQHPKG